MNKSIRRASAVIGRFLPKYAYALVVTPYFFTLGVLFQRHRFLIFEISRHFGLKMPTGDEYLPQESLSGVLDPSVAFRLLEPEGALGNVTLVELLVIANLARRADPAVAFEIGTFDGRTTLNIAANLRSGAKVFTLDLPKSALSETKFEISPREIGFVDKEASGLRFSGTEFAPRIEQLFGDSATFDFGPYAGQMGLIFIDGSHVYEYVRQDTATALRLAAPGAVILWHDYQPEWPDVIRALNELSGSEPALKGLRKIEGTSLVMLRCGTRPRPQPPTQGSSSEDR